MNLELINEELNALNASQIIQWSDETFDDGLIMSTSFGIQSAVMLHLVTQIIPNIPIIWIDTGYLPAETYSFAEELTEKLKLNLHIYQSHLSPARMEAIHGKLWEQDDIHSLNHYHYLRKVEPMQKALKDFQAVAWLAGLRRDQTDHRQKLQTISYQEEQYKILPILDWNSQDIYHYLKQHNLPYHPLFEQGYVTVGDWHSSRPLQADDLDERSTRFGGLKQECGLHLNIPAENLR